MVVLKEHQIIPIEFMKYNRGLILFHTLGSGKTLTALYAVYQFKYDIIIIGSKSSRKTFKDNIAKANLDPNRVTFYTYTKIKRVLETNVTVFKGASVIVDEAHALRNENMYNLYIASALMLAAKVMLLTATPVVNYLNDLSVLINIVRGEDTLPTDRKLFDHMFYDEDKLILLNQRILFEKIKDTISYYKAADDTNYPRSTEHYIEVEMSHDQKNEYVYYIKKVIYGDIGVTNVIDILNINYGMLPHKKRNFFLNVTRQISNTVKNSEDSPKIKEIYAKIAQGPYPVVVYSNFLKNGIYTLAALLENNKISYKTITGFTTPDKLNIIVNNYNKGDYKVLLLSSAGSESLDLKNTRQIHIMEAHWNQTRIDQVIGRTIRYKSHEALPPEERHVDIYHWVSIFPKPIKNLTADQYLIILSKKKKDLWDKYQDIIIAASIENNFMAKTVAKMAETTEAGFHHKYLKYKNKYHRLKQDLTDI